MAIQIGMAGTPSTTIGTPLKRPPPIERKKPQKKAKESKWDGELTTLTEGNLGDTGETVREVTQDAIDEAMSKQQIVLGELHVQIQELGTWAAQTRTTATPRVMDM